MTMRIQSKITNQAHLNSSDNERQRSQCSPSLYKKEMHLIQDLPGRRFVSCLFICQRSGIEDMFLLNFLYSWYEKAKYMFYCRKESFLNAKGSNFKRCLHKSKLFHCFADQRRISSIIFLPNRLAWFWVFLTILFVWQECNRCRIYVPIFYRAGNEFLELSTFYCDAHNPQVRAASRFLLLLYQTQYPRIRRFS